MLPVLLFPHVIMYNRNVHSPSSRRATVSTVAQKLITADEFFRMPEPADGSKQELVHGEIVTMPPTGCRHADVQLAIGSILRKYVKENALGTVTVESGVRTERDPDSVRGPDVSFWSAERIPLNEKPVGYPNVAADLCVEFVSPSDRISQLRKKATEYLNCGVRMVWIADPEDQTVTIYRQPGEGRVLSDDAEITGEDVLPGFRCRIGEIFK
jgi:Uma2 family endonuclease